MIEIRVCTFLSHNCLPAYPWITTQAQSLYTAETEQVGWQYHVTPEESAEKNSNEMSKFVQNLNGKKLQVNTIISESSNDEYVEKAKSDGLQFNKSLL